MARTKSVLVCALLLAACASARPAALSDTAHDAPAATHPDARADSGCTAALLGRHLSPGNLSVKVDGAGSSLLRRAATSKIVAGSVVGGVALTTLLLAALFLWRRAHRPAPTVSVAGRSSDALGAAMDLPKLPPGGLALSVDTRSPTVHRLAGAMMTPLPRPESTLRPAGSSLRSPVDLVARARRCSDWSHLPPPSSPSSRPGSPSSPRLRTVGSNGSLTFAPSAYQSTISLRPKASTSSLRSPPVVPAHAALQPLIIPPIASASNPPSTTALSAGASTSATSLKRQRSLASMLDIKAGHGGADSPSAETLRAETPRAVVRYEADALISGCNGARTVRYEVEEDAGTWTEEVVRLPPRYSTLQERPLGLSAALGPPAINAASASSPGSVPASSPTMQMNV